MKTWIHNLYNSNLWYINSFFPRNMLENKPQLTQRRCGELLLPGGNCHWVGGIWLQSCQVDVCCAAASLSIHISCASRDSHFEWGHRRAIRFIVLFSLKIQKFECLLAGQGNFLPFCCRIKGIKIDFLGLFHSLLSVEILFLWQVFQKNCWLFSKFSTSQVFYIELNWKMI